MTPHLRFVLPVAWALVWPRFVCADEPASESPPAPRPERATPSDPARAEYTTPFQLRGVFPGNGVRVDSTAAHYRQPGVGGWVTVVFVSGQVRLLESLALLARWGVDDNSVTRAGQSRFGILNPTLGMLFGVPLGPNFRFAASTNIGIPVATGGGNAPDVYDLALQQQGILARSAFDNTAFAVNDIGFPTGLSLAYIYCGLTAQADATVIPSVRVKGALVQRDASRVNSTYGLFLAYRLITELSVGIEARYQRYLTTPSAVQLNPAARDNLTLGGGIRLNLRLSESVRIRPALSYSQGLRGRVEQQSFEMIGLDVPASF
jgi:hypothetical protein